MRKILAVGLAIVFLSLCPVVSSYKESDQIKGGQSTHQFIMKSLPTILRNDGYPHLADFVMMYKNQMKYGSIMADETIWDSREHYMDPFTHEGFLGFKSAGQLADERFGDAVSNWLAGDMLSAFYDLGWSTHLVQDLTVPHHAARAPLDYHSEYEQWVFDHQHDYLVASGGIYTFPTHMLDHHEDEYDPFDWVDLNAHFSIDYLTYVNGPNGQDNNVYSYATSHLLPRAQRTTAGYVYMFLSTVNSAPVADAGGDKSGKQTESFFFDGSQSTDDMAIANYTWEFGDSIVGYGLDLSHIYSLPGTYGCNLTVRDSFGLEATDKLQVFVQDGIPPTADAGEDANIQEGESVHLDASGSSDNVNIAEYKWILNGAVIGYGPLLEYLFETYGVYIVTLHVKDEAGHEASDSVSVWLLGMLPRPAPMPDWTVSLRLANS